MKIQTILLPLILCTLLASSWTAGAASKDLPRQKSTAEASFETSKAWTKLGTSLQQAWQAAEKANDMNRSFQCFVRIRSPYSQGDQDFLQGAGFNVQVFAGTIARGSVSAAALPRVANLYFVEHIDLSSNEK